MSISCQSILEIPPLASDLAMPGFYEDNDAWKEAVTVYGAFEDAVSDLAAAYFWTKDDYYAECLISFLSKWAKADALSSFPVADGSYQAWYQTESSLFAAALALSVVAPEYEAEERTISFASSMNG